MPAKRQPAAPAGRPPKMPAKLGDAVDVMYALQERRREIASMLEDAKSAEHAFEGQLIEKFSKAELEGAKGKRGQCTVKRSDVPTPEDWDAIEKHIRKTGEFDLMERRLSRTACRERWEQKRTIPGVGVFTKVSLSVTKVK